MIRVGISGHRKLGNSQAVSNAVDQALDRISAGFGEKEMCVISPLAEGADRLVAWRGLELYAAELVVALPFEEAEYMKDFDSDASKAEFADLIRRASEVVHLPAEKTRTDSYLAVGKYVIDQSDVLIAIWDGMPARGIGGTGQIVEIARSRAMPVAWIEIEDPGQAGGKVDVRYERFPDNPIHKVEE